MCKIVFLFVLAAWPLAAQLNFQQSQKLYEEALGALEHQNVTPWQREKLDPLLGRLRSARGWNNTEIGRASCRERV